MKKHSSTHDATDHMFALVGEAITRWSFVEEGLSNLFSICTSLFTASANRGIHFHDSQVPTAIFYAVESFRGKLNIFDQAVSSRLSVSGLAEEQIANDWAKIREKAKKLSLRRNRLAHWTVLPAYHAGDDETISPARLVPPIGSPKYYKATGSAPTSDTLRPIHIEHLALAFHLLSEKIFIFSREMARNEAIFDRHVRLLSYQLEGLDRDDPTRAQQLRAALSFTA